MRTTKIMGEFDVTNLHDETLRSISTAITAEQMRRDSEAQRRAIDSHIEGLAAPIQEMEKVVTKMEKEGIPWTPETALLTTYRYLVRRREGPGTSLKVTVKVEPEEGR